MRKADEDLKVCERATPGPWPVVLSSTVQGRAGIEGEVLDAEADSESLMREEDAQFVSVAREALPWWIRRAQELEEENEEMRERISRLTLETE
ncbi:MAG: hypothetical protein R6U70_06315 [Bacillota bacterium]